jgi:putative copper export protein
MSEIPSVVAIYASTLLFIGASAASSLLQRVAPEASTRRRRVAALALAAGGVLWMSLIIRLLLHTVAAFDDVTWPALITTAWRSRWGRGWRLQLLAVSFCVTAAAWYWRSGSRAGLRSMSAAAAVAAIALPLVGHSAPQWWTVMVAAMHLAGAGLWLGSLAALVSAGLLRPAASDPSGVSATVFQRFSATAFVGAACVVVTGTVMGVRFVGTPAALADSTYGRLLLAKLFLFAGVIVLGLLNWRRARVGAALFAPRWELGLAAAMVIVTGVLTETAHP